MRRRTTSQVGLRAITVAGLLLAAFTPFVEEADGLWPPPKSPDMVVLRSGAIGTSFGFDANYVIFKQLNSYRYVGIVQSIRKNGVGLDLHEGFINVLKQAGTPAPGLGSMRTDDPYGYLPRDGQTWEYNANDRDSARDKLGWRSDSQWVELPKTGVPATWDVLACTESTQVGCAWLADPSCWRGDTEMREGLTYTSEPSYPWDGQGGYVMDFKVVYYWRQYGWWSCYGSSTYYTAGRSVPLWP